MAYNTRKATTKRTTYEGGRAYSRSPEVELYLLAANSLMSGDTFYESMDERLVRFEDLFGRVYKKKDGGEYLAALAIYCREALNLRTIPTMLTTELLQRKDPHGLVAADRCWVRGDEHLEAFAFLDVLGTKRTKYFLRAVAQRLNRLTEKQAVKYAAKTRNYSQKDVVLLSHPEPKDAKQSALFKYIRHGWDSLTQEEADLLPLIKKIHKHGHTISWEQEISTKGSTTENWENSVGKMGYMALLRNLRNLIEKGISYELLSDALARITDPEEIKNSKQFPFRFYSAIKAMQGVPGKLHNTQRVINSLCRAMDISVGNLEHLDGHTVVLVDLSGSMDYLLDSKSTVRRDEVASLFGAALVRAGDNVEVWGFSNNCVRAKISSSTSVADGIDIIMTTVRHAGTYTEGALLDAVGSRSVDRIILITDEQAHDNPGGFLARYVASHPECNVFIINLAGYSPAMNAANPRIHVIGGFSDNVLRWIKMVEEEDPVGLVLNYVNG